MAMATDWRVDREKSFVCALFPILQNPAVAIRDRTNKLNSIFNVMVAISRRPERWQFGMVHGSINNEEDEVMLPRRENTWEKAQKISSYGNSRHIVEIRKHHTQRACFCDPLSSREQLYQNAGQKRFICR